MGVLLGVVTIRGGNATMGDGGSSGSDSGNGVVGSGVGGGVVIASGSGSTQGEEVNGVSRKKGDFLLHELIIQLYFHRRSLEDTLRPWPFL